MRCLPGPNVPSQPTRPNVPFPAYPPECPLPSLPPSVRFPIRQREGGRPRARAVPQLTRGPYGMRVTRMWWMVLVRGGDSA